jgi:prepilin peptidase CpaA
MAQMLEKAFMEHVPQSVAWMVSFVLLEAAVIDGRTLRVPNWLTYHFAIGGLVFAYWTGGIPLLGWSLAGCGVGLLSLLPLYSIGGMGAGDVKLMIGMGAWIGPWLTLGAFISTTIVGGLMGLAMMAYSGDLAGHLAMVQIIGREIVTIRNPAELAVRAAARKPEMMLLPYGIPIAIGSIGYFSWSGLLF